MESSVIKAKMAKYTAKTKARKLVFDQKYKLTTSRLIRAHERLARLHNIACNVADQSAIDRVYACSLGTRHGADPPKDDGYDSLLDTLHEAPMSDSDLQQSLSSVRRNFKNTLQSWERLELGKYQLEQINEMSGDLYALIKAKKGVFWTVWNVHCRSRC